MKWIAVKRSYHGADEVHRPWIVMQEGQTRGICECWDEDAAKGIAGALNCYETLGFSPYKFQPLESGRLGEPSLPETLNPEPGTE